MHSVVCTVCVCCIVCAFNNPVIYCLCHFPFRASITCFVQIEYTPAVAKLQLRNVSTDGVAEHRDKQKAIHQDSNRDESAECKNCSTVSYSVPQSHCSRFVTVALVLERLGRKRTNNLEYVKPEECVQML